MIFSLLVLSFVVFCFSRLAPGDPLRAYYGDGLQKMNTEQMLDARHRLGLDKPIYLQYGYWLKSAIHGDFGISLKYKEPAVDVINDFLPNTFLLGGLGFVLIVIGSLTIGVYCIFYEGRWVDRFICYIGTITSSIPPFWLALMFLFLFSVKWKLLPSSGAYDLGKSNDLANRLEHIILPLLTLAVSHIWYYAYMVRNKLSTEVREEYVRLSKSKGMSKKKTLFVHCLKNIMPTFLSLMALSLPHLLGGTYVIETVFNYPGLGLLSFESAKYHDYNMLMVLTLMTGFVVIAANDLAIALQGIIDPRMKNGGDFK
jgi:peptide/nickel transport system permease protein